VIGTIQILDGAYHLLNVKIGIHINLFGGLSSMKLVKILVLSLIVFFTINPTFTTESEMLKKAKTETSPLSISHSKTVQALRENTFSRIGPQIVNTNAITAAAGNTENGTALMYVILQGEPAKLAVIDLATNQLVDEQPLKDSSIAWAIAVDSKGMVWVGGTPNEQLYCYNPNTKKMKKLGKASNKTSTSIHDLEITKDGTVFGSSSYGGNVFRYIERKGFKDLGQVSVGKKLARSLAYSDESKTLFVGLGSKAELVAWNQTTNKKKAILPKKYQNETSIYDLDEEKGVLFAKLEPSKKILLFNSKSYAFIGELDASSRGVSPISPDGKKVYYTNQYHLYEYDLLSKKKSMLNFTLKGTEAVSLDFVNLSDGPALVGLLGNTGTFLLYHLNSQTYTIGKLPLPPLYVPIYNIASGLKGTIYSSGFVTGHMSIYDPESGTNTVLRNIGQAEGITALNEKMYLGIYPGATVYEYNPFDGYTTGSVKPLFSIGYGQDRTLAMVGVDKLNKLFIGTHPKNGEVGGALAIYDTKTKKLIVRKNIVPNQSIACLAYSNGYIYGGTSIFSGKNLEGKANAVFFRLKADQPNGKIEILTPPTKKPRLIHALLLGSDQRIWGLSDGNLFEYDVNKKSMKVTNIVPTTSGRFKNGNLLNGQDGNIYGSIEKYLFRVNPKTMKVEMLQNSGVDDIATDPRGDIYFSDNTDLWVYRP
jgi:hypothetical protein